MAAAIGLRDDFDGTVLRGHAKATKDAAQGRRLVALAEIYDGGSRSDGARIGAVGRQTVRDWVLRFNASGPARLINGKAPKLNDAQRQALAGVVERGVRQCRSGLNYPHFDRTPWLSRGRLWDQTPLSGQALRSASASTAPAVRIIVVPINFSIP